MVTARLVELSNGSLSLATDTIRQTKDVVSMNNKKHALNI